MTRTTHSSQSSIRISIKIKKQQANNIEGMCFLWGDTPFSIAKNSPFYQSMFDVVGIVDPRYKVHVGCDKIRGPILQNEKVNYTRRLEDNK